MSTSFTYRLGGLLPEKSATETWTGLPIKLDMSVQYCQTRSAECGEQRKQSPLQTLRRNARCAPNCKLSWIVKCFEARTPLIRLAWMLQSETLPPSWGKSKQSLIPTLQESVTPCMEAHLPSTSRVKSSYVSLRSQSDTGLSVCAVTPMPSSMDWYELVSQVL